MSRLQFRMLPDGRRLHLQDGPIDLVIGADGPVQTVADAFRAATSVMDGLLDDICAELPMLRAPATPSGPLPDGPVARRMACAVAPYAADTFITPMAAVAGSVADEVLAAMLRAAPVDRAFVNDGGDIALHCAPGHSFTIGLIDRPDRPGLFGRAEVGQGDGVGGIATSGWRGRSFSRGIADSVTILARSAAAADAAATMVANAVELPGHPAVRRAPADAIHHDSDLGPRLVTRDVGPLAAAEIDEALDRGVACADDLVARGLILGAALQLQGRVRTVDDPGRLVPSSAVTTPEIRFHA